MTTISKKITNLYASLKATEENEIIIKTTYVPGGWHDVEFEASAAGFAVSRFSNHEYEARHEFSECYKLTRISDGRQ